MPVHGNGCYLDYKQQTIQGLSDLQGTTQIKKKLLVLSRKIGAVRWFKDLPENVFACQFEHQRWTTLFDVAGLLLIDDYLLVEIALMNCLLGT